MANRICIKIGLANLPEAVDVGELKRVFSERGEDYEAYRLAPAQPGSLQAAAFDLMLVVGTTGSLASIAALLWMAYERFIAPKKTSPQDNAGIYIAIRRPDGTLLDFWIGNTHTDREAFIHEFSTKVTVIREAEDPRWSKLVAEVEQSGIWVRQRKRPGETAT